MTRYSASVDARQGIKTASLNGARLERSASLRVVWSSILVPTLLLIAVGAVATLALVEITPSHGEAKP